MSSTDTWVIARRRMRRSASMLYLWLGIGLLAACGGGGEEGTGITAQTTTVGVVQRVDAQSVTVNDVSYDRTAAAVVDGFDAPLPADDVKPGTWVELNATTDDNGNAAAAQRIKLRPAARGVVSGSNTGTRSITVLDTQVVLGDSTVVEGAAGASALADGDVVEVHGPLPNSGDAIEASRVAKLDTTTVRRPYELRGRVSGLDAAASTFMIGKRPIAYGQAQVRLTRSLANGMVVRVASPLPPVAGQPWAVGKLYSDQALLADQVFVYVVGNATGLDNTNGAVVFQVEGLTVDASSAGNRAVVREGMRIAAFGNMVGGVLKAKSIAEVTAGSPEVFILSGAVSRFASVSSFRVRDVLIDASAPECVYVLPATAAALADRVQVRVRGALVGPNRLRASVVEFTAASVLPTVLAAGAP